MTTKILFLHGLEGSPNGRKATALRDEQGWTVIAPSLPADDFSQSVNLARQAQEQQQNVIPALQRWALQVVSSAVKWPEMTEEHRRLKRVPASQAVGRDSAGCLPGTAENSRGNVR